MAVKPNKIGLLREFAKTLHYKTNRTELPFTTILLPFFDPKTTIYYHYLLWQLPDALKTTINARIYGLFLHLYHTKNPLQKPPFYPVSTLCKKPDF